MASHHFTNLLLKSSAKIARVIGNSLLYGSIFALITGSLVYAATGTKLMSNFLSSGVDFISFFSGAADGNIGIDAKSFYARTNGSWLGYPADNRNYLRNDTFMSGTLYDENNSAYYVNPNGTSQFNTMSGKTICLNGDCKTNWPTNNGSGLKGVFLPHVGKSISCVTVYGGGGARVLADGTIQLQCNGGTWSTGSIRTDCSGYYYIIVDSVNLRAIATVGNGLSENSQICSATWP